MSDLGREIAGAVTPDWDPVRAEIVWAGLPARRRRRTVARLAVVSAAAACVLALWAVRPARVEGDVPAPVAERAERIEPRVAGVAHEEIAAGAAVASGPLDPARPAPAGGVPDVPAPETAGGTASVTAAERAEFGAASSQQRSRIELGPVDDLPEPDRTAGLLEAADAMRRAGRPADAVVSLRAVLVRHPDDPRAPLAAFTLGRVLLDDLDQPLEAAAAFAAARRLAPDGPLAEDAFARQIEALARAGETDVARTLAREYLEQFPTGRKAQAVRRIGGIEP